MRGTWQGSGTLQTTGGGSGGPVLAVIVAAILIGSGAVAAIIRALEMILIILGCAAGLVVIMGIAWAVWQAREDRWGRPIEARVVSLPAPDLRARLGEPYKPATEPARELHLHLNVSPDQLAGILRHYTEE
jgi:hypothetical protein